MRGGMKCLTTSLLLKRQHHTWHIPQKGWQRYEGRLESRDTPVHLSLTVMLTTTRSSVT